MISDPLDNEHVNKTAMPVKYVDHISCLCITFPSNIYKAALGPKGHVWQMSHTNKNFGASL